MEDETGDVGLKPKTYSFLVANSELKKTRGVNRIVVATKSHDKYKDFLLNKNCIGNSVNRIRNQNFRRGTYHQNLHCLALMT